jgi:hypothetical protein
VVRITTGSILFAVGGRDLGEVTLTPLQGLTYHGPDGNNVRHSVLGYRNAVSNAISAVFVGHVNGSAALPTATDQNCSMIYGVAGYAGTGTSLVYREPIRIEPSETWSGNGTGLSIRFQVVATGTTSQVTALLLSDNLEASFAGNILVSSDKVIKINSVQVLTAQQASASQAAVATTAATQTTPWGFSTAAQADGIITLLNAIRTALVTHGLIKGSA